jgi:hypothetical protein
MIMELPPPGPPGALDRLGTWMRRHRVWQCVIIAGAALLLWVLLFAAWIGIAILRNSTDRDAGAVALNLVSSLCLALVMLFPTHGAIHRWFWHLERKRATGLLRLGEREPRYGSEPTAPAPRVDWPLAARLRHGLIYLLAVATILYAFAPYEHQLRIVRFVAAHSAGGASAGSLSALLFGYLPMVLTVGIAMLLTHRGMRRLDAGLLDQRAALMLRAETVWLFSFAAAFTTTVFLCRIIGGLIVAYL